MPPFWAEPNKPEEPKAVEVAEPEVEHDLEAWRLFAWRMRQLIEAFRFLNPEPLSLEDIDQIGLVAEGNHDLHDACAALRAGCTLSHLVIIFT